jgi:CheY-like chemotaxis protein
MTLRMKTAVVLSLCVLGQAADLAACGDKFLVASRGTRFQRAGLVRRPASVLVYAAPGGRLAATVTQLGVAEALTKVGYRPTVVTDGAEMARQLRESRWDLVLVDLADVAALPAAGGSAPAPAVVTVAYDVSGAALAQARRGYDAVIRKPGRSRAVVDAVDDALFARALRAPAGTRASN